MAASFAETLVRDALRDSSYLIHQISGRPKNPSSLLRKVRQKAYDDPAREITDLVAVRVISYFRDHVDPIAETLSTSFDVDDARSVDKRTQLDVREFGYRSVHLIVRARLTGIEGADAVLLRELWFEIQVRSVLEHAWAEIEHDVVYKSGVRYPETVVRRFAGIAAQLERLDEDFLTLRSEEGILTDEYVAGYTAGNGFGEPLDAARLAAVTEVLRPTGRSFRAARTAGGSLPPHVEATCVEALLATGIESADQLRDALQTEAVITAIENYASLEGITSDEVSSFAVCVIVAAVTDPSVFMEEFADLVDDPRLLDSLLLDPNEEDED